MPKTQTLFYPVPAEDYASSASALAKIVTLPGAIAVALFGLLAPMALVFFAVGIICSLLLASKGNANATRS